MVERVRSDGNWIVGDPEVIGERSMLLAYHPVDADPLPNLPGWETPQYGFSLNYDGPMILCMSYHPVRRLPAVQLSLFEMEK